jgi:hypothetical protein
MIRRALLALALACACGGSAIAAPVSFPISSAPPAIPCVITVATAVVCNGVPRGSTTPPPLSVIAWVYNNSLAAQTVSLTCYDNATTASGHGYAIPPLAAGQVFIFGPPGISLLNGGTCLATGVPSGEIDVFGY